VILPEVPDLPSKPLPSEAIPAYPSNPPEGQSENVCNTASRKARMLHIEGIVFIALLPYGLTRGRRVLCGLRQATPLSHARACVHRRRNRLKFRIAHFTNAMLTAETVTMPVADAI
jgi:hypothetical protein